MNRQQLREILLRSPGSQKEIAKELGIAAPNVSIWLAGRMNSRSIEERVLATAKRILAEEQRTAKLAS